MSDAEKLIELAKGRFEDFGEADEILFVAVAKGKLANYAEGGDKDNLENADSWGEQRIIKANRIEWLCCDRQTKDLVTDKGIKVMGAKIEGAIDIGFAEISFPLRFYRCIFKGKFDLMCSNVKALYLNGSRTGSIQADGVKVEGSVFLRDGFRVNGEISLSGAVIGGYLVCEKGEFINEGGTAISASGADIKGNVFLRGGFRANGEICFRGAAIGGDFDCAKGEFINKGGTAISADKIDVKGSVHLRKGFKAEGNVVFVGAIVGGSFSWTDVELTDKTTLDLRNAVVGVLLDDAKSWPKKGDLFLDGFAYENIGDGAPKDAKNRIEWLSRQGEERFRPGPYEQLAKVLEKMGHSEDAKKILIEKEKKTIKLGGLSWSSRLWKRFLGLTICYGYRPLWTLGWIVAIIGIGTGIFWRGYKAGVIVPVEKDAYVCRQGWQLREGYPKFNSFVYSVDEFVPVLDLHMKKYWRPDANKLWGNVICWYMRVHICAGWILTTLLIVGLTGLVKK